MKGIQASYSGLLSMSTAWLIISLSSEVSPKRIQQFTLYSGGQGEAESTQNFTDNVRDLDIVASMVRDKKLQSVCSQLGVWAFFTGKNYSAIHSYGYHPATPGWTCSKRRISADYMSPFESIRHLGNRDLDIPSLSLYREPFFACQELYFHGNQLSLPARTEFSSFGFTGRESWTLYKGPNFSGDSVCLQCKCDEEGIAVGVTYTAKLSLIVSSIRKGCFGNQTLHPDGVLRQHAPTSKRALGSSVTNTWPSLTLQNTKDSNASLTISGTELRLAYPETFDSFTISRKSNWTLFSDTEQEETNPTCLIYSKDEQIQYFTNGPQIVGSMKLGCSEKAASETVKNNLTSASRPENLNSNTTRPFNGSTNTTDVAGSSNSRFTTPVPSTGITSSGSFRSSTQAPPGGVTGTDSTLYNTQALPGGITGSDSRLTTQTQYGGTGSSSTTPSPRTRQGKEFDLDLQGYAKTTALDSRTGPFSSTSRYTGNTLVTESSILSTSRENSARPGPIYRRTTTPSPVTIEEIVGSTNSRGNLQGSPGGRTTENPEISEKFGSTSSGRGNQSGSSRVSGGRAIKGNEETATGFARTTERLPVVEEIVSTDSARTNLLGNAIPTRPTEKSTISTLKSNSSNRGTDSNSRGGSEEEASKVVTEEDEAESETSTASIFFIAFLVTLGFLILAMIVAIGICIYLKVTRTDQTEITE